MKKKENAWNCIGEFSVDSGTFLICDPLYIEGKSPYKKRIIEGINHMTQSNLSDWCISFSRSNTNGFAVIGDTIIGDGVFHVYSRVNNKGKREIKVTFN